MEKNAHVYILKNQMGRYNIGITNLKLTARLLRHNKGMFSQQDGSVLGRSFTLKRIERSPKLENERS